MFITAVSVRGFADLAHFDLSSLERIVHLRGPDPSCTALGDAIELAFAALSEARLKRLLNRWNLLAPGEDPQISGDPFPEQATWTDTQSARALLPPGPDRHIQVELEIECDPILYGELRAESAREPRLVIGLSDGGRITLGVSALFATSFDALAIHLQRFEIGGQSFPLHGSDRPTWITRFLRLLVRRFHRFDPYEPVARSALNAAISRDQFTNYQSWQSSLGKLGTLRAAEGAGGQALILLNEQPIARWGRERLEDARLGAATHLFGADVLWAETTQSHLDNAVEGDHSPLEQVFRVHPKGTIRVESAPEPESPPLGVTSGPRK